MSEQLDLLANEINKCFATIDRSTAAIEHARIEAGKKLIEAKKSVETGKWQAWCSANIKKDQSDIRKCMALARADDPVAALEKERKNARDRMARRTAGEVSPARAAKPKPSLAALAMNRPMLKVLSREQSGAPSDAEAMEQDPNSPPGVTRHLAHIRDHGMVQVATSAELEARDLDFRFETLSLTIRRLAKEDWPTLDDLDRLDAKRRLLIEARLHEWVPRLQALLAHLSRLKLHQVG